MVVAVKEQSATELGELLKKNEIPKIPLLEDFFNNSPFERISIGTLSTENPFFGQGKGHLKDSDEIVDLEFRFYEVNDKILGFEFETLQVPFESILAKPVASFISAVASGQTSCRFSYSSIFDKPLSIKFKIKVWGMEVSGFFPESEKSDVKIGTWLVEPVGIKDVGDQLEYLSKVDLTTWIPDGINEVIKLSGFQVIWSQSLNTITFATFNFALGDWPLLPGLQFKDVEAELFVSKNGPLGGGLAASLHLGEIEPVVIECGAELRKGGYTIQGSLKNPLSLNKLQLFQGIHFPEVTINDLELSLEKDADQIDISSRLEIASGWKGLSSVVFFANLSYSGEAVTKRGEIEAVLEIGSSAIIVSARYEEENWVFKGSTSRIDIGSLLTFFSEKLKISAPNFLKDVTLKHLSLAYYSKSGFYLFKMSLPILLNEQSFDLELTVDHSEKTKYSGTLKSGDLELSVEFDNSAMVGRFKNTNLSLAAFLKELGVLNLDKNMQGSLDFEFKEIDLRYDFNQKQFILLVDGPLLATVVLSKKGMFFGVKLPGPYSLPELPLIGKLPDNLSASFYDLQVLYAKGLKDLPLIEGEYPAPKKEGFDLSMGLKLGQNEILIEQEKKTSDTKEVEESGQESSVKWISVDKTLGFISIEKVALEFSDGKFGILMEMSAKSSGMNLSVLGLKFTSPLAEFKPEFSFEGIAVDFKQGGISISGGLKKTNGELLGELVMKTPAFSLAALGGYATLNGHPSLFVFGYLDYPLGGDPSFFIKGVAAGFGYNRNILIPAVDKVTEFPFIKWARGDQSSLPKGQDGKYSAASVLNSLTESNIVCAAIGKHWLAIGLKFTTYELIESFALAVVKFGPRIEVNLLGVMVAKLPDKERPFLVAELQIKATFIPDDGYIGIEGSLSRNSFLFDRNCHLTGGFAYCLWFSGPHAGDFVLTVGGYGSRFKPPAHFPKVNLLRIQWKIGTALSIDGGMYFAITSKAMMAGGYLKAVWKSGGIRAWFSFQADFLMYFDPFKYYMAGHISLGASFDINLLFTTVTISIHLGVSLEVWGPPFSGKASVDLSIISFTIYFGSSQRADPPPLRWSGFKQKYLPNETEALEFNITNGLKKKIGEFYLIDAEHFECVLITPVPMKVVKVQGETMENKAFTKNIGVGPSLKKVDAFTSEMNLSFTNKEQAKHFTFDPQLKSVPKSLWGTQSSKTPTGDPTKDTVIHNAWVGMRFTPKKKEYEKLPKVAMDNLLFTHEKPVQFNFVSPEFEKGASSAKQEMLLDSLRATFQLPDTVKIHPSSKPKCFYAEPISQTIDQKDSP